MDDNIIRVKSIDLNIDVDTPKTYELKKLLDSLASNCHQLNNLQIDEKEKNVWELKPVKEAKDKLQASVADLYRLVMGEKINETTYKRQRCYYSVNMKEVVNCVKYVQKEWFERVKKVPSKEDPNVTVFPAIDFLIDMRIPEYLKTCLSIELSELNDEKNKVPVTILTGFLGSGKTTLLNYILKEKHGMKICVIENEFGAVGIDDELINQNQKIKSEEQIIEMLNGCICCTVRGDLINVLHKIMKERKELDLILIETTGLADPAPILQSFYTDPKLGARLKLDGVITVVDCINFTAHLEKDDKYENECLEQIAFADRVLLNKVDLLEKLINEKIERESLQRDSFTQLYQEEINNLSNKILSVNQTVKIIPTSFSKIELNKILQIKAFDLDKVLSKEEEFFLNFDHQHDDRVTSVCFSVKGSVCSDKLNEWFSTIVREHGKDIFRAKGIFSIEGSDKKLAFHGVHMLIDSEAIGTWGEKEDRECKCVFIGRNLQDINLEQQFKSLF